MEVQAAKKKKKIPDDIEKLQNVLSKTLNLCVKMD
jgi:hypothetical protein